MQENESTLLNKKKAREEIKWQRETYPITILQ